MEEEQPQEKRRASDRWHIGREIPVAVLVVLLFQTGGGVWWASRMATQMETLTKTVERFDGERYTKEDARRDRELMLQMFKNSEIMVTQFDRRISIIESQHEAMRKLVK